MQLGRIVPSFAGSGLDVSLEKSFDKAADLVRRGGLLNVEESAGGSSSKLVHHMLVPSETQEGHGYIVNLRQTGIFSCECADHVLHQAKICKHIIAVALWNGDLLLLTRRTRDNLAFSGEGGNKPNFNMNKHRGNGNTKRDHLSMVDRSHIFSSKRTLPLAAANLNGLRFYFFIKL